MDWGSPSFSQISHVQASSQIIFWLVCTDDQIHILWILRHPKHNHWHSGSMGTMIGKSAVRIHILPYLFGISFNDYLLTTYNIVESMQLDMYSPLNRDDHAGWGECGVLHSASCNICTSLRPCLVTHGHHSPDSPYAHWHKSRTMFTWQTPMPPRHEDERGGCGKWRVINAADQWHYQGCGRCETPPTWSVLDGVVFRGHRDWIWDAMRREAESNWLHASYPLPINIYFPINLMKYRGRNYEKWEENVY